MHKAFTELLRACAPLPASYSVYLPENTVTREIAADRAGEFPFVLGQPRPAGSVQAIIHPLAIR